MNPMLKKWYIFRENKRSEWYTVLLLYTQVEKLYTHSEDKILSVSIKFNKSELCDMSWNFLN